MSTGQKIRLMREVGLFDLGDVQYQELEAPAVALDNQEEWAPLGLWAEMTENGPVLRTRCLLSRCPHWHDGCLCFWCRKAEAQFTFYNYFERRTDRCRSQDLLTRLASTT